MEKPDTSGQYTCNDYREEMILLGLQTRLACPTFTTEERKSLLKEIARVERHMGLD